MKTSPASLVIQEMQQEERLNFLTFQIRKDLEKKNHTHQKTQYFMLVSI